MCRKISAHVDGGLRGGSRVRRPGSEDPHRRERKFSFSFSQTLDVLQKLSEVPRTLYFFSGAHAKIWNPTTTPSVVLNSGGNKKKKTRKKKNFCSRRLGSSLPGLHSRDPPLSPPSTWAEIFRRTCLQSHLQTSPPTHQKLYPKFRNPRTNLKFSI